MAAMDMFVSVVVPLDDAAAVVDASVRELVAVLRAGFRDYEVVLVDDGSRDHTRALVDRLLVECDCLRSLRLSRRYGLDVAVTAGLDAAIGDCVVILEPGADPPHDVPRFVTACRDGGDVVIGACDRGPREGGLFGLGRRAFYWLCRRLITDRLPTSATHFMAFSRRAVNAITRVKQHNRHLGLVSCTVGYPTLCLPYERRPAAYPPRRTRLGQAIPYAVAALVTNTVSPLRLVTYIGAFAGLANLLYVAYVCAVNVFKKHVAEGWTTLSLQVSGLFFLVFLSLMVISEYLAHTFQASKGPPLYHVLEERSSPRFFADPERRNVVAESPQKRVG